MDPVEQVGTAEQRLLQMLLKGLPTTDRLAETLAGSGSARAAGRELPTSELRFPDGAAFRIEIPSVEGPACLEAVLGEAERLGFSMPEALRELERAAVGPGETENADGEADDHAGR